MDSLFHNRPSGPPPAGALELLYVQDQVVSGIIPYTTNVSYLPRPATVTLELGGATAVSTTAQIAAFAPGVFTSNQAGTGNVAAVNADGTINSPLHPSQRGSMVLLYGTGFFTENADALGTCGNYEFASNLVERTAYPIEVDVAGERAWVLYAGSAPGLTCGLQQVNVIIPNDSATGPAVPLQLRAVMFTGEEFLGPFNNPAVPAQNGLTIAIQ